MSMNTSTPAIDGNATPAAKSLKKAPTTKPAKKAVKNASPPANAPPKGDTLVAMLARPEGATIEAMMEATGWQQHSVRGFLAGTVKKKLGRTMVSEIEENVRVYRITDGGDVA